MKYNILKKLKINRPTITLTTLLFMLAGPTSAWADGSWISDMCRVTLSGGTLTVRPLNDTGAMQNYTSSSDRPWNSQKGNITSIVIGSGVTSIGDYAFSGFTNLTSVTFEANSHLATIGHYAFNGCNNTNFTSITIPARVSSIGNSAFGNCSNLASVTFEASSQLTTIDQDAFSNCKLATFTIPVRVASIGNSAFSGCTDLATVTVFAPSCTLGTGVFADCNSLSDIYVFGDKVANYQGATNWSNYNIISEIPNSGNCGATGHESDVKYVLTGTSPNYTLTIMKVGETGAMADYGSANTIPWYSYRDNIEAVVINDGVTSIGNYALSNLGNANFTSLTIPISVKTIGTNAVYNCQNLETVDIGNGVETIGLNAFKSCSKLENLTIGSSVTSIGNYAFNFCSALTSVTIPANVEEIKYHAFNDCSNLASVTCYATNVPSLGEEVFDGNKDNRKIYVFKDFESAYENATNWSSYADKIEALTPVKSGYCGDPEVNSGENVKWELVGTSGNYALHISGTGAMANYSSPSVSPWDSYWASLKSVVIEDGVTSIGERAFRYLTKVTTISLGSDVTRIGKSAFGTCKGLTSVIIPNNVTDIDDGAFSGCIDLETISFGSGVTRIGMYAFQGCTSLSSVNLPDNLTIIGGEAFRYCNNAGFTSIDIPASVTSIGNAAFSGCTNLATVTLNSNPNIAAAAALIPPAFDNNTTIKMNLTATIGANGEYWMTFYNKNYNFEADENTQVFKAALSEDKLTLRELTANKIVTRNKPVILKSTTNHITLTRTTSASSNDFDTNNSLSGVSAAEGKEVTENPSTIYALNSGAQGVGFYKVVTGNTIGVGNAYVTSTSTSDFLPFVTVVASGNCGTTDHESDVTWELTDKGTLTISGTGTGAMADFGWAYQDNKSPFCNNTNITSIVIGEGVTSIGNKAFLSCSNLATVSIPSTLATIGDHAFHSCSNLTTISVAAGNTNFATEDGILYNYDKTTAILCPAKKGGAIALPATVTTLPTSLFNGNTNITSLDLSACTNLTTISGSLCYGCTALASVTLPASVSIIDQMAFEGCNNLTTINLSQCSSLNEIRTQAFNGCALLAGTHTLPNTITSIGSYAFNNCAALQELVIQSPFTTFAANGFGSSTFDGCTLLKLSISDTDLAEDMLSNTNHNWHRYAYMLKTMPFTASGVTLSPILNNISATLDMTSNTAVEIAKDIAVSNVNLTCTLTEGKPCTVMFPFASTPYFIGGGTFYEFTGVEYNGTAGKWIATMTAKGTYDNLTANTPYLLVPTGTAFNSNITTSSSTVTLNTTTNSKQTVVGDWTFKGVYAEKTWAAADCGSDYGFAAASGKAVDGVTDVAAGDFVKLAEGAHIKPMRAYLTYTGTGNPWATTNAPRRAGSELPQSICVVLVNTDGSTTEIGTLTPSYSDSEGVWYSLDGVRLNGKPTTKGLYINNGRKVVLK